MFRTIRARLTLGYVALLALILILFSGALYFTLARSLDQQVDDNLSVNAEQAAGAVNLDQGQVNFQNSEGDPPDVAGVRDRGYLVRLLDANGAVTDTTMRFAALPITSNELTAARNGQTAFETLTVNGQAYRVLTHPIIENSVFYGVIQVAQSLDAVTSTLQRLVLLLAIIVPLTLAFASIGGVWFAQRALAPMDRITRAAQRISAQDLGQRLDLNLPDDEVGRLARTFDAMLERLDEAFRRERQFTADASHELRTPLTVMRGEIDVVLNRPRSKDEYTRVLRELGTDVDRLTEMANDLLMLARADASKLPLQLGAVSAARLLQAVAEEMRPLAEERGITLLERADETLTLWADEDKLLHVLFNLIENALKFTPRDGTITLSAARDNHHAVIAVADTGIGVAAEHLPHLFERFYRVDEAHASHTGGAGLGLAIAHALVVAQGGTITAHSVVGQGTTFTIRFETQRPDRFASRKPVRSGENQ